jgi:uncharacterized protein YaeQ
MALTATMYHLRIDLSDVDRGVYEVLDLRVARHPSETLRYMLLRTFAYCLCYSESVAFSKGLFVTDEPAVWAREPDGRVSLWCDVGHPTIERLHKASKLGARVVVFTDDDVSLFQREAHGARVHRGDEVELWSVSVTLLSALEALTDRKTALTVVHHDGELYVTVGAKTLQGTIARAPLVAQGP